jgi:NADH-quinone oxidoreductase subunit E
MNHLFTQHAKEVEDILSRYPADQKRSAVMPLLHLAQAETGFINKHIFEDISEITGASITDIASIVGYYTLFHDAEEKGGRFRIQVCTDLPCALRGADEFLQQLCNAVGIGVGETTPDGLVTIEAVTCLAGCDHAPLFQVQGDGEVTYHQDQTVESASATIADLRKRAPREVKS